MEPSTTPSLDSRMRFGPWLQQTINEGSCPGLEWLNNEQGMFKIPWYHFNKSQDVHKHFKVFRDWAVYTGIHVAGDDEDYPKYKRNFRCALNKVPDIAEVRELHSDKFAQAPYKVYRFLNLESLPTKPEAEDTWILVENHEEDADFSMMSLEPVAPSGVHASPVEGPVENTPDNACASFPSSTADIISAHQVLPLAPNIPTVVMEILTLPANICQKPKESMHELHQIEDRHQQPHQLPPQQHLADQQQLRLQNTRKSKQPPAISSSSLPLDYSRPKAKTEDLWVASEGQEHLSCPAKIDVQDAVTMSLSDDIVIVDLETKEAPSEEEVTLTGLIGPRDIQEKDEEGRNVENISIPSDLGSVSSDDLLCASAGYPTYPSSLSLDNEPTKNKASPGHLALPQTVTADEEGIDIKVFYGFHLQKVLERTLVNPAKGCSVYYGQRKRDIPDFAERMYGPYDALQVELPVPDICGRASPKLKGYMEAILREMQRGVVLTTERGDVYARRYCRTRAFVYDQDKHSWPLSRKINIPEKIFDFDVFCSKFEKYKQSVLGGGLSTVPPVAHVHLTFGHRVPLEDEIRGKVLVAMLVTHRRAEQMLSRFQSELGIENPCVSGNRFLSSMDTMDRLIENYDSMNMD
ncbi:hypothetical protein RRG08_033311 [Elysia crispata]|uniref:IRF tryptophan pentad repeat domain-containing protein n=1 Tax=Elysia crispata TaxID=231223 RepID=A0AAE1CIV9_9GAST|nr:hypothetical protein RRG08_033311 [Elysia crispata]